MNKILVSGVAALAIASSASATNANLGDFLIAPAFYAGNGFSTELKVVNTNQTHSVAVRGVVRDSIASREVDFVILLTPGDVWTGTVSEDASGRSVLTSSDDSNYMTYTKIYNRSDTMSLVLPEKNTNAKGGFESGYVEFYPMIAWDETDNIAALLNANNDLGLFYYNASRIAGNTIAGMRQVGGFWYPNSTIDKNQVSQKFEDLVANPATTNGIAGTAATGNGTYMKGNVKGVAYTTQKTNPASNINGKTGATTVGNWLMGEVKVVSNSMNAAMTIPMRALQSVSVEPVVNIADHVIANQVAMAPSADTQPSLYVDVAAVSNALSASEVYATYENSGSNNNILFTFWNDTTDNQNRYFYNEVRGLTECMCSCLPVTAQVTTNTDACPTCTPVAPTSPTSAIDPISGQTTTPTVTPTTTTFCNLTIANEFGQTGVSNILGTQAECDAGDNFSSGWVRLMHYTVNNNAAAFGTDEMIATQMKATQINGHWSFNWQYVGSN